VKTTIHAFSAGLALVLATLAFPALSQPTEPPEAWPTKPVKFLVPFAAGGGADIAARLVANAIEPALGQRVVVENRPGSQGSIGAQLAAKAPPDGYTVFVGTVGINAVNQYLFASLPYDPVKDFAPVTVLTKTNNVLTVAPDSPFKTLVELIRYAKQNPDKLNYGIPAAGDTAHLSFEQMKFEGGIPATSIPYNSVPGAMTDVMGGRIQFLMAAVVAQQSLIAAGKLRPLAVTSASRLPTLPNVPTVAESGFPGFEASGWTGLFMPAGTPPAIVSKLSAAVAHAYQQPDVIASMNARGFELASLNPQEFTAFVAAQRVKWSKVIRDAKIRIEQ
jgi:tripartite-type tricarboxylate transporter receptor subunit TctC